MMFRYFFLTIVLISIGCSTSKNSTEQEKEKSEVLSNYGVIITPISEEVKVEFVSSLPSDTLFPYSSDTFEPIAGHEGYIIDAASGFEEIVLSIAKFSKERKEEREGFVSCLCIAPYEWNGCTHHFMHK